MMPRHGMNRRLSAALSRFPATRLPQSAFGLIAYLQRPMGRPEEMDAA